MAPNLPHSTVWLYPPSFLVAIIATVLFAIIAVLQFYLTIVKYRSWYFVWVFIGATLEVVGYAARVVSTRDRYDVGAYAVQSSFIIVAPLFVAAGDYLLFSRLALLVLPDSEQHLFGLRLSWVARVFITCDVITFVIQATGAAIVSSGIKSGTSVSAGKDILISGLCIQVITFSAFIIMSGRFHARLRGKPQSRQAWKKTLLAIYVSSICIMVRTLYRLVEFALGIEGYPFIHEWIFYVFESLPMLPAIGVFCIWHPSSFRQIMLEDANVDGVLLTDRSGT